MEKKKKILKSTDEKLLELEDKKKKLLEKQKKEWIQIYHEIFRFIPEHPELKKKLKKIYKDPEFQEALQKFFQEYEGGS